MDKISDFDKKKFFWDENFENELRDELNKINSDNMAELLNKSNFISKLKIIVTNYPFLYLSEFFNDFISGNDISELYEKNLIHDSWTRQEILDKIFPFKERHYRAKKFDNARELNLRNYKWSEKFESLINNCDFFSNQIERKLFENILRVHIIYNISVLGNKFTSLELKSQTKLLSNDFNDFENVTEQLKQKFEDIFNLEFDEIFEKIINQLLNSGILEKNHEENLQLMSARMSIDGIKDQILKELNFSHAGIPVGELENQISQYFPSLKLIPNQKFIIANSGHKISGTKIFAAALSELLLPMENEPIIKIKSKPGRTNSAMIYLVEDHQRVLQMNQLKIQNLNKISTKFYGRQISPENFIAELVDLEKGSFDDKDDQVTRIAGLVLAESLDIKPPQENISEFDFSTDISRYIFRDDQKEAMMNLNFVLNSKIFHCKVMLDNILNMEKLLELKKLLPDNEAGIVITFRKIPKDVKEFLKEDKSIQVIDEEGLKIWVGISSKIPSRKNSVCKIYFDPISGIKEKIAQVNLIDYEQGIASVKILPEMIQESVFIGSLEEIGVTSESALEFKEISKNYFEFLTMISKISILDDFIAGLFDTQLIESNIKNSRKANFIFEHHHVELNLDGHNKKEIAECNCMKYIENPLYICPHIITTLDHMFRKFSSINPSWNSNDNPIQRSLEKILNRNISIILDRLDMGVDDYQENRGNQLLSDFISGISQIKEN